MNYDPQNLLDVIKKFPSQFEISLKEKSKFPRIDRVKKIMICGMGGSAFPSEVVSNFLGGKVNIAVSRGYKVPEYVTKDTLILLCSYSGNTEETISSFLDAKKKKLKTAVLTAGGELLELANKYKVPFLLLPSGIPPRCALGHFFTSLIIILEKCGLVSLQDKKIQDLAKFLQNLDIENSSLQIAKSLQGKLPIIYSSNAFSSIAQIWKIKINENSKQQAFYNVFPELNHNEMIGWTTLITNPHFIFIRNNEDHPNIQKRMDILKEIFREKKLEVTEVWMEGRNVLEKMFSTLYIADFVSYHLAIVNKLNPYPVDLVEDFKKRMTEIF